MGWQSLPLQSFWLSRPLSCTFSDVSVSRAARDACRFDRVYEANRKARR